MGGVGFKALIGFGFMFESFQMIERVLRSWVDKERNGRIERLGISLELKNICRSGFMD